MQVQINARYVAAAAQACIEQIDEDREKAHAEAHEREVERAMRAWWWPETIFGPMRSRADAKMRVATDSDAQWRINLNSQILYGKQRDRAQMLHTVARQHLRMCEPMSMAPVMFLDDEDIQAIGPWLSPEAYTHD